MPKTVLVGMSGGVDSSVSAALLLKKGYRVIGGFMKNWSDAKDAWTGECSWRGDRRDAMRVAAALDVPLVTFDFEDLYRAKVIDAMFAEYRRGRTPTGCLAHREIKFGVFLSPGFEADFIATGHYARRRTDRKDAHLLREIRKGSELLASDSSAGIEKTIFPIGDFVKSDGRALARSFRPDCGTEGEYGDGFTEKLPMKDFAVASSMSEMLLIRWNDRPHDGLTP